jgi:hypothetical protein
VQGYLQAFHATVDWIGKSGHSFHESGGVSVFRGPFFYRQVAGIASKYQVPVTFHCHGPVWEILDDVWEMSNSFGEAFEPPPPGDLSIAEAFQMTAGKDIVFGGLDNVLLNTSSMKEARQAVERCLNEARYSN